MQSIFTSIEEIHPKDFSISFVVFEINRTKKIFHDYFSLLNSEFLLNRGIVLLNLNYENKYISLCTKNPAPSSKFLINYSFVLIEKSLVHSGK